MKQYPLLFALLFGLSATGWAQTQTLFDNTRVVGGFGAPITEIGINNSLNTSVGGGGAVIINSFWIGGYGMGSIDFEQLFEEDEIDNLEMGHGGIWLGFNIEPYKLIHLYASGRIGWGAVDIRFNDNGQSFEDVDQIFVMTPELGLEINVTNWFRLAGAAGYRFVNGLREGQAYEQDDFQGAIATITLRFGGFGHYNNYDNYNW